MVRYIDIAVEIHKPWYYPWRLFTLVMVYTANAGGGGVRSWVATGRRGNN